MFFFAIYEHILAVFIILMKEQAYFEVENQNAKRKQINKYKWSESEVQRLRCTVNLYGCDWLEVA